MDVTYLPRSWWTDRPPHGHRVPHSQFIGLAVHHTVFVMADWDGDGILHGDLDDIKRYMERLRTSRPDLGPDVPYSYVVFPGPTPDAGIVVEGRGPGQTGAHTRGFNSTRYGVAFAGNTMVEAVTPGVVEAVREVGRRLHDPLRAMRSFAHRDKGATLCPGDGMTAAMPELQPPFFPLPQDLHIEEPDLKIIAKQTGSNDDGTPQYAIAIVGGSKARPLGFTEWDKVWARKIDLVLEPNEYDDVLS